MLFLLFTEAGQHAWGFVAGFDSLPLQLFDKRIRNSRSEWQLTHTHLTMRLTYRRRGRRWSANMICKFQPNAERKGRAAVRCRRVVGLYLPTIKCFRHGELEWVEA